jgi:hypothetical protein
MSPYSAVAFASIGLALAVLPRPSLRPLAWSAATVMIAIGAVSFLGYLWNASELVTDRLLPPVAVNTAVAFVLLGAGTLLATRRPVTQQPRRLVALSAVEFKILAGFIGAIYLSGSRRIRRLLAVGHPYPAGARRLETYLRHDLRCRIGATRLPHHRHTGATRKLRRPDRESARPGRGACASRCRQLFKSRTRDIQTRLEDILWAVSPLERLHRPKSKLAAM